MCRSHQFCLWTVLRVHRLPTLIDTLTFLGLIKPSLPLTRLPSREARTTQGSTLSERPRFTPSLLGHSPDPAPHVATTCVMNLLGTTAPLLLGPDLTSLPGKSTP